MTQGLPQDKKDNRCVDCGAPAPHTDTNYTLISSRYGWRLTRSMDAHGNKVMEWRCPDCWQAYRTRSSRIPKK
jgi:hypothetical protein